MNRTDENKLYQAYRSEQSNPSISPSRLSRAFELAQSQEIRPYDTTENSCTCPDHTYRQVVCKHMAALRIQNSAFGKPAQPATPAEVSPDAGVAELRRIRVQWLETADRNGDFDTIYQVMDAYGIITTPKTWVFVSAQVKATLTMTGWRSSDTLTLTVEVDGRVVCQDTRAHNFRYPHVNPKTNRLFIPGKWMDVFRTYAQAIQQREINERLTTYESERRSLLNELCIPQQ